MTEEKMYKLNIDKRGVAYLSLARADIHNAFNDDLINQLTRVIKDLELDKSVRLLVLTGEGKSFCAGADLNWMKSMIDYSQAKNLEDSKNLFEMFDKMDKFSKPIIGKINGHAIGGGVGLVAICDYALTHEKTKFAFSEVRLGLVPAVISSFCIKKIGLSHARAWFLSGERFNAQKACEMGLIHEVTKLEEFDGRTEEVVSSFLAAAPEACVHAKNLIRQVSVLKKDSLKLFSCTEIAQRRVGVEGQEGMSALLEKRKPNWIKND